MRAMHGPRPIGRGGVEQSDDRHALALLRARRERPRHCRAAEQRDELAACSGRDVHFMARPPPRSVRAAFPHTAPASGV